MTTFCLAFGFGIYKISESVQLSLVFTACAILLYIIVLLVDKYNSKSKENEDESKTSDGM